MNRQLILRFMLAILALTITALPTSVAFAQMLSPFAEQELPQIWKPAPTPPGSLDWHTLMSIDVHEEEIENFLQYVPTFTPTVKALNGKKVKLNGYMVPLDANEFQTHFILMAYPHACPFHMPGGPGSFVEIKADIPVNFTYDPVLVEGHFEVLTDFSNGLFYRINAANPVTDLDQ